MRATEPTAPVKLNGTILSANIKLHTKADIDALNHIIGAVNEHLDALVLKDIDAVSLWRIVYPAADADINDDMKGQPSLLVGAIFSQYTGPKSATAKNTKQYKLKMNNYTHRCQLATGTITETMLM